MLRRVSHDRHGSHAGRGFRHQDAVAAWLCVRIWAGIDPPSIAIPEGNDDVELRSATGSTLVQAKSRREHLGPLPIADACEFITALWDRHDKVAPTPMALELAIERPVAHHKKEQDGWIEIAEQLSNVLPGGTRGAALLAKTKIRHVPEPAEAAIGIIAERANCSPLAAKICFAEVLRQVGRLADANGRRTPLDYLGMSASDTDRAITDMLAATDVAQIELAVSSGICEPVDFVTPLDDPDFYLGVDVKAGHVAAGLVVPRVNAREAVARAVESRGAALVVGPSGAGKSAIMWEAAHALRHTVRWYQLLRVDPRDLPAIRQLLKTLRADSGSPVGLIVDDVGRRGAVGWDALTRDFAAIPGAILLGSIREEDLFLVEGRVRAVEVRAEPDQHLAERIYEELKRCGETKWGGWKEPWTLSQGLILEYAHILSAGQRFEQTLADQIAARRRDPERSTELTILSILSLVGAAGASADPARLASVTGNDEADVSRALARLIEEHLVRRGDFGQLTGLHQLRSAELVRLTHAIPPPTLAVTFARSLDVVRGADLEPLTTDGVRNRGINLEAAIAALAARVKREPCIDALSAILRGLGSAHIAESVERWLARPHAKSLAPTQVGTAVMLSFISEPLPAINSTIAAATAAGEDLRSIRLDTSADPRRAFLEALPSGLVERLVAESDDAATLNRLLAAQIGMPLHASIRAGLRRRPVDITSAPLDATVELLGTLTEIDRPAAISWVDEVGEQSLLSRLPAEVPWATEVSFEEAPDGRVIRCDHYHMGVPDGLDAHAEVVRICEVALALSPSSDIAASVARTPGGLPAVFNGHSLAEKRIPRGNLPTASLPAWNRRWRDSIALRVATPSYTEYLSRAGELLNQLIRPLERVISLVLRNKNVPEALIAITNAVFEAAEALTPPATGAANAAGGATDEFNPHVTKLQNLLHSTSADLIRRFHELPAGAAAFAAWTGNLISDLDDATRNEPWDLIGNEPPSLQRLRSILVAVRLIAGDVSDGDARPATKYRRLLKTVSGDKALRRVSTHVSSSEGTARARLAAGVQDALEGEGLRAVVQVVEDLEADLPWPPNKVVILVPCQELHEIGVFYQTVLRARELIPETMRLVAIPVVGGTAVPEMGQAGYATMLPLSEEARDWCERLEIPSSPSHVWTRFDRTAAVASALQSMDRLSLGVVGRSHSERETREQLEGELTAGRDVVQSMLEPLNAELAEEALLLLDMIRTGEAGYADAVHTLTGDGEIPPILEQLFGLRILIEQAELEASTPVAEDGNANRAKPRSGR